MSRPPSRSLARTSSICSLTVTRFYGGFQSIRLSRLGTPALSGPRSHFASARHRNTSVKTRARPARGLPRPVLLRGRLTCDRWPRHGRRSRRGESVESHRRTDSRRPGCTRLYTLTVRMRCSGSAPVSERLRPPNSYAEVLTPNVAYWEARPFGGDSGPRVEPSRRGRCRIRATQLPGPVTTRGQG